MDTNPTDEFRPRPFRFEAMWVRDPHSDIIVNKAWSSKVFGSHSYILCRKQSLTTLGLKKWNKEVFGHYQTRIKELSSRIEAIQMQGRTELIARQEAVLQGELNEWLRRNEALWRQKSRETWLKDGDKNSKKFHLSTIIRRKRNSIDAIKNDDGDWLTSKKDIREHVTHKSSQLFHEEPMCFPQDLEQLINPIITHSENFELCKVPSPQEIKSTIFDMFNQKAPGPDGLPALFYKKYWSTVGHTVTEAIQSFFTLGRLLKEVNNSFIVLIPKVKNPSSVNHFRPISLCNTIYKTISKLLVSRLCPLLDKLISPS